MSKFIYFYSVGMNGKEYAKNETSCNVESDLKYIYIYM